MVNQLVTKQNKWKHCKIFSNCYYYYFINNCKIFSNSYYYCYNFINSYKMFSKCYITIIGITNSKRRNTLFINFFTYFFINFCELCTENIKKVCFRIPSIQKDILESSKLHKFSIGFKSGL